jgi:hypothetical protein
MVSLLPSCAVYLGLNSKHVNPKTRNMVFVASSLRSDSKDSREKNINNGGKYMKKLLFGLQKE